MAEADPDFDALRARYAQERARREHASDRRYRDIGDGLSHLAADPYSTPTPRAPLTDSVEVLIVGGGFGGLLTAARLREAGVNRIRIVEAGGDVGGTWYWNRYPGAACDVESYIYFPLLEETGYMPVERYSKAAEIRAHCRRIADRFGLYGNTIFSTQVTRMTWDSATAHWRVETDRGDDMRARFVILTTGPLNRPKLPAIPGIESFKGHSFHTSRWDYDYTGGSATETLTRLAGKRVGIIGTGATAVQCVPPLARSAEQLLVFQRTPSSVDARDNAPTDPAWVASLEPGWQQRRVESFTCQFTGDLHIEDLVGDGWTVLARAVRAKLAADPAADPQALLEEADLETMVRIRARVDAIVEDPKTADALKPWFSLYCKRPCFHDEYLQSFNRPNVTLVDTQGRGVERITGNALVVDGREYPIDCLIFATGFETSTDFSTRSGFEVIGIDGEALHDKWLDGMVTLHGLHSRGFPNCFVISHAQSGMSVNFPHMLDEQAKHLAYMIGECRRRGVATLEATAKAEQQWVDTILGMSEARRKFLEQCTPGFYNNEGRASPVADRNLPYGAGPIAFIKLLREWRETDDFAGLELDGAHAHGNKETANA
ncbi:MAG: NAD(P)/FAD-dependent oxidoreductase [Sphingomonadaceae bacterium]|nr:NAD(P)/FAD-dependent oxidoreductase [Sphingomonadaceae bacterium]